MPQGDWSRRKGSSTEARTGNRQQTISEGDRVAGARTALVFLAVEAGDSGQLRPAGDTEWSGSDLQWYAMRCEGVYVM